MRKRRPLPIGNTGPGGEPGPFHVRHRCLTHPEDPMPCVLIADEGIPALELRADDVVLVDPGAPEPLTLASLC
jgi:hypothetical protein